MDGPAVENAGALRQLSADSANPSTQSTHPRVVHMLREHEIEPGRCFFGAEEKQSRNQRSGNIIQDVLRQLSLDERGNCFVIEFQSQFRTMKVQVRGVTRQQVGHTWKKRFVRDVESLEGQQARRRRDPMPINAALVNLAGVWRNRDNIINEIQIADQLERIPEKIR